MRTTLYSTVALVILSAGLTLFGQDADLKTSLQPRLTSQFALSQMTPDRSNIASEGAVLVLQIGGLMMYSTASPMPPANTYKNGKISQGGSGFGRDFAITMMTPGNNTAANYPHRQFSAGEKVLVTSYNIQKREIVFRLYGDPGDGLRYYGDLKFPFEKGSTPTSDQALATIAQVLTVQPDVNSPTPTAAPSEGQGGQSSSVFGIWVHPWITDPQVQQQQQLQLNPDGTFSEPSRSGGRNSGKFTLAGDQLVLTGLRPRNYRYIYIIQGDKIYLDHVDDSTLNWVRPQVTPPSSPPAAPASPPVAPLNLPATYVSSQAPADQLQLNADHSFSLQEGGQGYHGTFVVNGNSLELTISESNIKTTATLQGNNLTDSSGQTWTLQVPSGGAPPAAGMLRNEDIIKMAKAGFDDGIIIAKISSSKCQFDTSTDALIALRQSGVSGAVIKAMLGAGK